ncbi:MAG: subclass B1 metallo-beta-lactamase [Acidobacteriota bacterium]
MGWLLMVYLLGACTPAESPTATRKPPGDVVLRELRPGIWLHASLYIYPSGSTFPSNGLIVREGDGLLLIDTSWGELATVELLRQIDETIGLPIRRAVITHFHYDRLAGVDHLESLGIEVWTHPDTPGLSIALGTPVPDRTLETLVDPGDSVQLGSVEVLYPGPGHTDDNLMVWIPDQRVLFGGCAVRPGATGSLGNTADADLDHWPEAIRIAKDRYPEAEIVIPSHGPPAGPELLDHTISLLADRKPDLF